MKLPDLLKSLWAKGFFRKGATFTQIANKLTGMGCNPPDSSLRVTLLRANYLLKKKDRKATIYIQKYPSEDILLQQDVLPDELIKIMGGDFKVELEDLRLNYGRSGTCSAFLFRKILEKMIYLAFAKNGQQDILLDKDGNMVGLITMIKLCAANKVRGKHYIMPKTAKKIEGLKFLGDTAAHNPLTNVSMKTIIPVMPFIVTAYEELSRKI